MLKRYVEALSAVERALGVDAADSESWLLRARILAGMQRLPEALASLDRAANLNHPAAAIETLRTEILLQLEAAAGQLT